MRTLTILLLAGVVSGCNERVGIAPTLTNDDNWAPQIMLGQSNYQRVQLFLSQPPELQIYRNLSRYVFYAGKGNQPLVPIDTVALPYYGLFRYKAFNRYLSAPLFEQNTAYTLLVAAEYHNGTKRTGGGFEFVSPAVKGKILRRLAPPPELSPVYFGILNTFAFSGGYLYALIFDRLYRLDPGGGPAELLRENLQKNDDRVSFHYLDMAMHGDTTFLSEHPRQMPQTMIVVRLPVGTQELNRDWRLDIPSGAYSGRLLCHDGTHLYLVWVFEDGARQIIKLDGSNGRVAEVFPKFQNELLRDYSDNNVAVAGNELWIATHAASNYFVSFDNRLSRFDARGEVLAPEHRDPVFSSSGLAWDGSHFWVFDSETYTFAQLELEGL